MRLSCLASFSVSSEDNSEVLNLQKLIQRLVGLLPRVCSRRVCVCLMPKLCVCVCASLGCCQPQNTHTRTHALVAPRRLFDLDGADGSRPAGCFKRGWCRHAVEGCGGEYTVPI